MSIKLTTQGILTGSLNPSNVNIFLNADFHDRYSQTTGWDTGINGTELATSWGGYNAGVANPTTCHHAHLTTFGEEQEYVYEYIKENETWLGISQGSLQSKLTIGQTYTFSCEQYITSGSGNYLTGGLYYKKASTNTQGFHLGSFNFSSSVRDEWRLCIYTFTVPNDSFDTTRNKGILHKKFIIVVVVDRIKIDEVFFNVFNKTWLTFRFFFEFSRFLLFIFFISF